MNTGEINQEAILAEEERKRKRKAKIESMTEEERAAWKRRKRKRRREMEAAAAAKVTNEETGMLDSGEISVEEVVPSEEVMPVEEIVPVEEVLPVEEEIPVEEVMQIEEEILVEEVMPVEEEALVEEVMPIEEEALVEEMMPVEEEVLVEEVMPVEEDLEELISSIEEATNQAKAVSILSDEEAIRLDEVEANELMEFFIAYRNMAIKALTNPIEAMKDAENSKYETRFLSAIFLAILMFLTVTIHVPILQHITNILDRMKLAGAVVALGIILFLILTGMVYILSGKQSQGTNYKDVAGAFSIAMAPMVVLCFGTFLMGYLSVVGTFLMVVIALVYWMLLSSQITMHYLKGSVLVSNAIIIIISVIIFFVVYFSIKMAVLNMLASAVESSVQAVQSGDGTATGSVQSIIDLLVSFLRDIDFLLGE